MHNSRPKIDQLIHKISQRLGTTWVDLSGNSCVRSSDFLLQGIYFNPSSDFSKFVPQHFVMALPIPADSIFLTIGERLKDSAGKDMWMDWNQNTLECVDQISALIQQQICPTVDSPLDIKSAINCISEHFISINHFLVPWSLGILWGLEKNWNTSREYLNKAKDILSLQQTEWKNTGKTPPDYLQKYQNQVDDFLKHLETTATFESYCFEKAHNTKQAIGLV